MDQDGFEPLWLQDDANEWWVRIGNEDPVRRIVMFVWSSEYLSSTP